MSLRERVRALVESSGFERFIITVIVVNAIGLGLETSPAVMDMAGGVVSTLDKVALSIFVVELALKLFAWQFEHNAPFRKFAMTRGKTPRSVRTWTDIPATPINSAELTPSRP